MLIQRWKDIDENIKNQIIYQKQNHLKNIYKSDPLIQFYVIKNQDELIGYVSFKQYEDCYDIYNFLVTKKYQRQGYGTLLLKRLQHNDIYLEVNKNNDRAIKLYEKLSFKVVRTINNYYNDGSDAYVMHFRNHQHESN